MSRISVSIVVAFALPLIACDDPRPAADSKEFSGLGKVCVTSSECDGTLTCIAGACSSGLVGDAGAGADVISSPGDTPSASGADTVGDDGAGSAADAIAVCVPVCKPGACVDSCGGAPCSGPCSDGSACTTGDACNAGKCTGTLAACDDQNPCTDDSCNPATGCTSAANTAPCSDENPCTAGDACKSGQCAPGAPKDCPSGDPCVVGKCSVVEGKCTFLNAPEGIGCSDGSSCTAGDACTAGTCIGVKVDCDDKNPCTADVCNASSGCSTQPVKAGCDDGNGCTEGDICQDGACKSGPAKACNDNSVCTKDICSPKTGACVHDAAPFEATSCDADGSACTQGDACAVGLCVAGTKADCNDGSACTLDTCDVTVGCKNTAVTGTCNADDNACTSDACTAEACKAGAPKACDDFSTCTTDKCDVKTGACVFSPLPDGAACDADASKCTEGDACKAAACAPGMQLACDDGNVCTDDACVPQSGCVHYGNKLVCDADGDVCTVGDTCKNNACQAGAKTGCIDGNPCTDDVCNAKTGACSYVNNSVPCSDGTPCTNGDTCNAGMCKGVEAPCDPCAIYGTTKFVVVSGHIRVCAAAMTAKEALAASVPKPWRLCSKNDMLKYGPAKSLCELGYSGGTAASYYTPGWTGDACSGGAIIYDKSVPFSCDSFALNSPYSYECATNAMAPFLTCRD